MRMSEFVMSLTRRTMPSSDASTTCMFTVGLTATNSADFPDPSNRSIISSSGASVSPSP